MTPRPRDQSGPAVIDERFDHGALDRSRWTPAYLPAWSSMAAAAAAYAVDGDGLHLTLPADHPRWCPDEHEGALRVSAVQSGNWSGPVGSTLGQQPFRDGLVVREEQVTQWGFTPHFGRLEVECRATLTPASMFSAWLVGLETDPKECGEICLVEVFGDTVFGDTVFGDTVFGDTVFGDTVFGDTVFGDTQRGTSAGVGSGIHAFRDPQLTEEFSVLTCDLDVSTLHRYAVDWQRDRVRFLLDGVEVKVLDQAPDYPMQLIIGLFDFPDRYSPADGGVIPELVVRRIAGASTGSASVNSAPLRARENVP